MANHAYTPEETRVLLDVMLGSLARRLRMLGYDAAYALDRDVEADDAIHDLAREESRVLLTRDRDLAERTPESVLLTEQDVDDQLAELRDAGFELALDEPARCATCNGLLEEVDPETAPEHAPADVDRLWACTACGQHYWKGSHWTDVGERLEETR
ncbi:Mut7-C RNAse domain-containing protein [Halocalculus aciditolerans]|uniref:Mut7-C RNAse domain-containing protein n=1 Tax=Halocalculus aciditolerans TaxID=1383812 RepID=A0A830FNJ1_9EURY|nr:Mut7-C RNAse domain-containing protein [Halocalculus aciditolerans]GGL70698.1 hypothetical protein GCM10009039_30960 [Halocalculus aciditolerans]